MVTAYRATFSAPVSASKSFFSPLLSKFSLFLLFLITFAGCATAQRPLVATQSPVARAPALNSFAAMPVYFIENRGQIDGRAAYYIRGKDKAIYFTAEGVAFSLSRAERDASGLLKHASYGGAPERWLLKLDFVGARHVTPTGAEPTPARVSYFKGAKEDWQTGVKTYAKLVYADLWPGIDLVYSGTSGRLKYEFVVKPGADPRRVRLAYRGASSLKLDDSGALEIATSAGSFRDDKPYAFQEIDGRRVEVAMAYKLDGESYGFRLGKYDRDQALVLDPAILIYAGFIGGLGDDRANGIAIDSAGAAYVTGDTESDQGSFPETTGAFDRTQNGNTDAFVAKVKPDGTGLVYATFIGGANDDRGLAIALEQGCAPPCAAFITGDTKSNEDSFPVTSGAFQTERQGGTDAFIAKLSDDGADLLFLTYFGGSGDETGKAIAVDGAGNVFITGETRSTENSSPNPFPTAIGPSLTQGGGGNLDAFVAKITGADGGTLEFSGFIGGAGDDRGNAIALDPSCSDPCDVYIAGETQSGESSFPKTVGPDLTHNGGIDGFVAKVSGDGSGLIYAGYIGGNGTDRANGIAVDSAGKAYVAGETNSAEGDFPDGNGFSGLPGADKTQNGGVDAFVVKVADDGSVLEYATYIGGAGDDRANAIAIAPGCVAPCRAFVGGETSSDQTTFPDKVGPDTTFNGGIDGFVAVVETDGASLVSAGYIGGPADDRVNAIAADHSGGAFVAGESAAVAAGTLTRFTTKSGPDTSQNGGIDAFVAKFCLDVCLDLTLKMTASAKSVLAGDNITYTLTISNKGPNDATGVVVDAPLPTGAVFVSGAGCDATIHCTIGALAKGATPVTIVITITSPTTTGQFTFSATVSADQTDTSPNGNTVAIKTSALLPDLTVKKITLDITTVAAGGQLHVTDTTTNKQSVPVAPGMTAAFSVAFYLSVDKIFDSGTDVLLNSRLIAGGLGAKGSSTDTTTLTIPALTASGTYFIIAVADDGNAVGEANEGNNTKVSKQITVP
jgi:uncharacterized repeat protein (TIGR01451 family)